MNDNPYEPSGLYESAAQRNHLSKPKFSWRLSLLHTSIGFTLGFALWRYTAPREAWDANAGYSILVVLIAAIASLGRLPGILWGNVGVYAGQLVGLLSLYPWHALSVPMAMLGVTLCGTGQALLGGAIAGTLGWGARRFWTKAHR